jgi:hypothetical protein
MAGPCEAQNATSVEFALRNAFVQQNGRLPCAPMKRQTRTTLFTPPRPSRGRAVAR